MNDQPARGSDLSYCSTWPDEGHNWSSTTITEHTLTHRRGVWYRVCGSCGYVDLSELTDLVAGLERRLKAVQTHRDALWEANSRLRCSREQEMNRTNEAARLSAEARDQAEDLRRQIGRLNEHIEIVESDRLDLQTRLQNAGIRHELD